MSSSGKDSDKRHRHDVGDVAHGAHSQESITRALQTLLGLFILATVGVLIYALAWPHR